VRQGSGQGLARLDARRHAGRPRRPANCDTAALERNVELGRKHRVQGTPALLFEDGTRAPGAIPAAQIEARMAAAKGSRAGLTMNHPPPAYHPPDHRHRPLAGQRRAGAVRRRRAAGVGGAGA
jgi:hypothetical protein